MKWRREGLERYWNVKIQCKKNEMWKSLFIYEILARMEESMEECSGSAPKLVVMELGQQENLKGTVKTGQQLGLAWKARQTWSD